MNKRICLTGILVSFLFGIEVFSQKMEITPFTIRNASENFAKIKLGVDMQNGTGSIVGADNEYIYILTALHCCIKQEEDHVANEIIPLNVLMPNRDGDQLMELSAEIFISDTKIDIAVLRVRQHFFNELSPLNIDTYFSFEFYNITSVETYSASEFEYIGLRGGTIKSIDYIKQSFISENFNDQKEFFAVTCNNTVPGHSGALIRNMQYEVVGMLLQINENRSAAKILKISEILNFLEKSKVPITYFKPGCYIGTWHPVLITFSDGFEYAFNSNDTIRIDSYGFSGAISGQLRIGDSITIIQSPDSYFKEPIGNGYFTQRWLTMRNVSIDQYPYRNSRIRENTLKPNKPSPDWLRISNPDFTFYLKKKEK